MLKIRLQRIGKKNDPSYRVIVTDSQKGPKSGNYIEKLGSYNPKDNSVALNAERITHWMSKGAQVSGTVHNILVKQKIVEGDTVNVLPKKSPIKKEGDDAAEAPAEEAKAEETQSEETAEASPAEEAALGEEKKEE